MKITVIGTGYVGLVTGTCFSEMGNDVLCVDNNQKVIDILNEGKCPIYETGLFELIQRNVKNGKLNFCSDLEEGLNHSNIYFIAVGTPQGENGEANLKYVKEVASFIGQFITEKSIIINKSTSPVGTVDIIKKLIKIELLNRKVKCKFSVISNPEFLKEGDAVRDFMYPDRIVIGSDSPEASKVLGNLYSPFSMKSDRLIFTGIREAELIKYAANSMLATKISFINEIATLCDALGIDVDEVRKGIGSDKRIGYSFIYPGCGYGGSCFPKDVKALINTFEKADISPIVLRGVQDRNIIQKSFIVNQIKLKYGENLSKYQFGIWGLSYKPGTNDMREAPSIHIISQLIKLGARVIAHDPAAIDEAYSLFPDEWINSSLIFKKNEYDVLTHSDALILLTEWKLYRNPDFNIIKKHLKAPVIFDGRNQYSPEKLMKLGFIYKGIGR